MAGATDGQVSSTALREKRRAATSSYSCTVKRFTKLIQDIAPVAAVEAEYQQLVATYQRIVLAHRDVVARCYQSPEVLEKEAVYEEKARQRHDYYTKRNTEYRLAEQMDNSRGDHEVSKIIGQSIAEHQAKEAMAENEETNDEEDAEEDNVNEDDDSTDEDYEDSKEVPEGDDFVEEPAEAIAAEILRDAQVPAAGAGQRNAVPVQGAAEPLQVAVETVQAAFNPQTQPAVKPKRRLDIVPGPPATQTTRGTEEVRESGVKGLSKKVTRVAEGRPTVKDTAANPKLDDRRGRQLDVQTASGPAAGVDQLPALFSQMVMCFSDQIGKGFDKLGTQVVQAVEASNARRVSAPNQDITESVPEAAAKYQSTPKKLVHFNMGDRLARMEDEEPDVVPEFPCELTSRFIHSNRSRGGPQGSHAGSTLKLPKVELTPFNGDMLRWDAFASSFDYFVHQCETNDAARLLRLRSLLSPEVQDRVAEFLHDPRMYGECIKKLKLYYGDPERIAQLHIKTILNLPEMKDDNVKTLSSFSDRLHVAAAALTASGNDAELTTRSMMLSVVSKLTKNLRRRWGLHAIDHPKANLKQLDVWLQHYTRAAVMTEEYGEKKNSTDDDQKPKGKNGRGGSRATVNATAVSKDTKGSGAKGNGSQDGKKGTQCFICKESPEHRMEECRKFKSASSDDRFELVAANSRCVRCLKYHGKFQCRSKGTCQVPNCNGSHHTMLHRPGSQHSTIDVKRSTSIFSCNPIKPSTVNIQGKPVQVLLQVVPVKLVNGTKSYTTYAFLDGGSQISMIAESAAKKLDLVGPNERLYVQWWDGELKRIDSRLVDVRADAVDGSDGVDLEQAYVVKHLEVSDQRTYAVDVGKHWPHLKGLSIPFVDANKVEVLIGLDNTEAHVQLDVIRPKTKGSGPHAFKTCLGWCLAGKTHSRQVKGEPAVRRSHSIRVVNDDDRLLHHLMEQQWKVDAMGTLPNIKLPMNKDAAAGLRIMEEGTKVKNNRMKVPLMWKRGRPVLPSNRAAVMRRFKALERRFKRDPAFAEVYTKMMEEYIDAGHARKVTEEELKNSPPWTWYLPHHGVTNPKKPGKVRVVFDCAALHQGTSINQHLHKGPDFLNDLLGIMLRFRRSAIALSADIKMMYHQVQVPTADQPAYSFFWRKPGSPNPPDVYRMTVHVFGSISSPSSCLYALRRVADDNAEQFPEAAECVKTSFYVDDCVHSVPTKEEAVKLVKQLTHLLGKGGFHLTKWVSSSRTVMATIPAEETVAPLKNFDIDDLPVEKTLGLLWDAERDIFKFIVRSERSSTTKRGVLSDASSLFDSLGLLAPVTLIARGIMQDIWRSTIDWDDQLPHDILKVWEKWLSTLDVIDKIRVPRYIHGDKNSTDLSYHVFVDASTKGYAAVVYSRWAPPKQQPITSIVLAKSKVAPLRPQLTVPRLELQAALLGARLADCVSNEMNVDKARFRFWGDSITVLRWVKSDSLQFTTFVANRVAEILHLTDRDQWRHVPTDVNPADIGSRGCMPNELVDNRHWFTGPEFLTGPESEWPPDISDVQPASERDPEIVEKWWVNKVVNRQSVYHRLINDTSDFHSLKRRVGWVHRFARTIVRSSKVRAVNKLSSKCDNTGRELSASELQEAETMCIKTAQGDAYHDEVQQLKTNGVVDRLSPLYKLSPFVDDQGILRVGGRLEKAKLPTDVKHPAVLHERHRLTRLIIWHFHLKNHSRAEALLADLRGAGYWPIHGRSTVKRIINSCFVCRRLFATPCMPFMAPLPADRVGGFNPPFTHTGLDYFGPIVVKSGRTNPKRWICLLTCMATRAVHLEVVHSMDTNSLLMAVQRFIDRRGKPALMRSDNGTNFVSGRKVLERTQILGSDHLKRGITDKGIDWVFNPPHAPHFGGVWERLVKSAKNALLVALIDDPVTDEVLHTVVVDVEALLNSRPLTHVSVSPDEPEPLTPNHFLFGRAHPYVT